MFSQYNLERSAQARQRDWRTRGRKPASNRSAGALLAGTVVFVAICAGAVGLAAAHLDTALARYPGSDDMGRGKFAFHLRGASHAGQGNRYRTQAGQREVWAWYHDELGLEPEPQDPVNPRAKCLGLSGAKLLFIVRRTIGVMICARPAETWIFVSQGWELARP